MSGRFSSTSAPVAEFTLEVRAWDYSHLPLNINGRICLYYSLMWGVLGVIWIKKMYPLMSKLILAIPDKVGKVLPGLSLYSSSST